MERDWSSSRDDEGIGRADDRVGTEAAQLSGMGSNGYDNEVSNRLSTEGK